MQKLVEEIWKLIETQADRIDALERRLAPIEERGLDYQGVWDAGQTYKRGDVCTYDGSMWVCKLAHSGSRPGTDHGSTWQLSVKRGKDGKDLR
jgi:hypothetical protein